MEENQITCPQCGLVNNVLADACVQCGIIFVKNPAMQAAAALQDDEKRKSIEAAEAILDEAQPDAVEAVETLEEETHTTSEPEPVSPDKDTIRRPDPHEDTVEIRIPKPQELSEIEEASLDEEIPDAAKSQDEVTAEIELEAIETSMETVTEPDDTEKPILLDSKADDSPKAETVETAEKLVEPAADNTQESDKAESDEKDQPVSTADQTATADSKIEPIAADPSQENSTTSEPERKPSESKTPAETEKTAEKPAEPIESADKTTAKDAIELEGLEIIETTESEVKTGEQDAALSEARDDEAKSQSAVDKKIDTTVNQEAQKAKNEALKKQQEALLKAEARKKEKAAQTKAAALKKKKLAQAKAEALKKQKAAQAKAEALKKKKAAQAKALALKKQKANKAKAEALKKQKAAQTKAEESAETLEVAAGQSNYVKLLGLLKRYKGKAIGINYDNSAEIKEAELVDANEEFFSVMVKEKKVQYSYPLKTILTIVEGEQGVEAGEDDKKAKFDAVIKVYPLVLF